MNDFEFFGTIGAFVAGLVLLVYLFKVRAKVIKQVKIRLLQAKAKIHYATRPEPILSVDAWGEDLEGNRNTH